MGSPQLVMMNQAKPTTFIGVLLPLGQVDLPDGVGEYGDQHELGAVGSCSVAGAVAVEMDDLIGRLPVGDARVQALWRWGRCCRRSLVSSRSPMVMGHGCEVPLISSS